MNTTINIGPAGEVVSVEKTPGTKWVNGNVVIEKTGEVKLTQRAIFVDPATVRALLFSREVFKDTDAACAWAREHGFKWQRIQFLKAESGDNNAFAICTAALGEQHTERWESCVQHLKERYGVEASGEVTKAMPYHMVVSKGDVTKIVDVDAGVSAMLGERQQLTKSDARWEIEREEVLPDGKHRFSLQRCNGDHVLRLGTDKTGGSLAVRGTFSFGLPIEKCEREVRDVPLTYRGMGPAFWLDVTKSEQVGDVKVEVLDSGDWEIERASDDEIRLQLLGKVLNGQYRFTKGADARWRMSGPVTDEYRIVKQSPEQRYSLGVAYPANKLDAHRDKIGTEDLERAAWSYMAKGEGRKIGLMHKDGTDGAGTVVESYIYRGPDWTVGDQVVKSGDWLLGVVWAEDAWGQIRKGSFTGYSIQGWALKS